MRHFPQKIGIAAHNFDTYTETFIRQHVENLPFDIVTLSGAQLEHGPGGLLRKSKPERARQYLLRMLGQFDDRKWALRRVTSWILHQKVDAMLAEFGVMGLQLVDACEQAGMPLIVHFFGYDAYIGETPDLTEKYRAMFAKSAAIIGVSRAMCKRLRDIGAPSEKVHYVPSYVNPEKYPQLSPGEAPPHLLAIGRFVEKKAPQLTILAFSKALAIRPDIRLEMVGDGPLLGACIWLAHALKVEHAIIFHGPKSHEWLASAMKRFRAFIQHSVRAQNGDSEGTPAAILEALCSGLPVLTTSHAGITEAVVDGETGFLCAEGDVEGMAQSILRICDSDRATVQAMSNAARKRFLNEYSREKTLDKLAEIIRQAIQN